MDIELPSEANVVKAFAKTRKELGLERLDDGLKDVVIYEMTDGMRTSTQLEGHNAYYDGGIFCLRFIHALRILGMTSCYVNVIEEKHTRRDNYAAIFEGLKRLYPIYEEYAQKNNVKLGFLGDLAGSLEPKGYEGNFSKALKQLEERTAKNTGFTAYFLINYSLDWAMKNEARFASVPLLDVTVRHTKFQFPTGMMLPAAKSDFCSLIYVQQGSAGTTWTDEQIVQLIALALRSKMLNSGTQYLKSYKEGEQAAIRSKREKEMFMVHRNLLEKAAAATNMKRAILAGPAGPEIYEF
jgi:hypothetical protein